jgi:hypothetical protein
MMMVIMIMMIAIMNGVWRHWWRDDQAAAAAVSSHGNRRQQVKGRHVQKGGSDSKLRLTGVGVPDCGTERVEGQNGYLPKATKPLSTCFLISRRIRAAGAVPQAGEESCHKPVHTLGTSTKVDG